MKKILLALVLFAPVFAFAQINQQCPQFTVNGTPQYQAQPGDQEICHKNYAVIHKCSVKAPVAVFEHLTVEVKDLIIQNVSTIINHDPRVRVQNVIVSEYESGIQIECEITYLIYNISENLRFKFDKDNNLLG